jgi:Proteasome subunit
VPAKLRDCVGGGGRSPNELASYQEKILKVDDHMGISIAGLTADARMLAKYMRTEALNHKYVYGTQMQANRLAADLADMHQVSARDGVTPPCTATALLLCGAVPLLLLCMKRHAALCSSLQVHMCRHWLTLPPHPACRMRTAHGAPPLPPLSSSRLSPPPPPPLQRCTQSYVRRPYGVGMLIAAHDATGPHLMETSPSGNYFEYVAMAIGARSQSAKTCEWRWWQWRWRWLCALLAACILAAAVARALQLLCCLLIASVYCAPPSVSSTWSADSFIHTCCMAGRAVRTACTC